MEENYCCNLSGCVALIVWFTTSAMCVKNSTIIYVARASNSKRDCDVEALPILTCERLNVTTSVREEKLRAWCLLLLAATVRSFAHMPLAISDRNTVKNWPVLLCWRGSRVNSVHHNSFNCAIHYEKNIAKIQ